MIRLIKTYLFLLSFCMYACHSATTHTKELTAIDSTLLADTILVPLTNEIALHWKISESLVIDDSLLSQIEHRIHFKQEMCDLILDTTSLHIKDCTNEVTLTKGDVAYIVLDHTTAIPFAMLFIQMDVFSNECDTHADGLFDYIHQNRTLVSKKLKHHFSE